MKQQEKQSKWRSWWWYDESTKAEKPIIFRCLNADVDRCVCVNCTYRYICVYCVCVQLKIICASKWIEAQQKSANGIMKKGIRENVTHNTRYTVAHPYTHTQTHTCTNLLTWPEVFYFGIYLLHPCLGIVCAIMVQHWKFMVMVFDINAIPSNASSFALQFLFDHH